MCSCGGQTYSKGLCRSCYDKDRRAKIKSGEWAVKAATPGSLTADQLSYLTGSLLGDGSLVLQANARNPLLSVTRQRRDDGYAEFEYNLMSDFCSSGLYRGSRYDKRTGKTYLYSAFRTRCLPLLKELYDVWYPAGAKTVPHELQLTPFACAVWFCDDGTSRGDKTYYGRKQGLGVTLYSDGFSYEENCHLQQALACQVGVHFQVEKKTSKKDNGRCTTHWYLRANRDSSAAFLDYILPFYPVAMARKLPELWRKKLCHTSAWMRSSPS